MKCRERGERYIEIELEIVSWSERERDKVNDKESKSIYFSWYTGKSWKAIQFKGWKKGSVEWKGSLEKLKLFDCSCDDGKTAFGVLREFSRLYEWGLSPPEDRPIPVGKNVIQITRKYWYHQNVSWMAICKYRLFYYSIVRRSFSTCIETQSNFFL